MKYLTFDIEIYKTTNNTVDAFVISKVGDEIKYFRNPNHFIEYVITTQSNYGRPVILVGYNSSIFDITFLCIWKGLIGKYALEEVNERLYNIMEYWFVVTSGKQYTSIYAQVKTLTYHPDFRHVDPDEVVEWIKEYHPSFNMGKLFISTGRWEVNKRIFHLDLLASVYGSGSLKVRSLIQEVDVFKKNKIVEFNHGELLDTETVEKYALADILATEGLLYADNAGVDYAKACLLSVAVFNIEGVFEVNSTICLQNRKYELKELFNVLPHANKISDSFEDTKYADVKDYIEFEKDLVERSEVNLFVDEYKFYKEFADVKQFKYSIELINSKGEANRGGLHCSEDYTILESNPNDLTYVVEADYGSLYPNIMASNLCPITTELGKEEILSSIRMRDELKRQGDATQVVYKLFNNTLYGLIPQMLCAKAEGKVIDSYKYALNYVTRIAQVSIIKLIQFVIDRFPKVKIGNVNTDSVMFQCSGLERHLVQKAIDEFNSTFNLHGSKVNATFYKAIIIFNTNGYIKVTEDNEFKYSGSKLNSVKPNKASDVNYPLFLNCKSIFFKLMKSFLEKGYTLSSPAILTDMQEFLKPIVDEEKPLFFYKDTKEVTDEIRGRLIDASDVSTNALTSKNFRYSGELSDPYEFCTMFFSNLYSKFFLYDYQEMINDFKGGKVFTHHIYGKDFIRSKYLTKDYIKPVLFCNNLIHLTYNSVKVSESLVLAPKSKIKVKFENPINLIDTLSIDATKVMTATQIENKEFKNLLPYVYDFDFKVRNEGMLESIMKAKGELLEDLKKAYEENPEAFLLIEWNNHIGDNPKVEKNGVHVIVLGIIKGKGVFKNILEKHKAYLDPRDNTNNITLYHKWVHKEYQCLGSKELLLEYLGKLFNFLYTGELHNLEISKKEIIQNAQKSSLGTVASSNNLIQLEEKYKNYQLPFKDLDKPLKIFFEFMVDNVHYSFSSTRELWFREIGNIKWVLGWLLAKKGLNQFAEDSKNFIYDILVKLCINCTSTGKASPNFDINDVIQVCMGQVFETFGEGLKYANLKSIYRATHVDLFRLDNPESIRRYKDLDNLHHIKDLIQVITDYASEDVEIIESITEEVLENGISFIEAPTGIGKTHSIVETIVDGIKNFRNRLFLVFCPTKNELKQLLERLKDKETVVEIGMFSDDIKDQFDKEREYDVLLITSAYLATGDILPTKLRAGIDYNLKLGKKLYSIIDEVDNAISALGKQHPVIMPYEYIVADFSSNTIGKVGFDKLIELTNEASSTMNPELLEFLRMSIDKNFNQSYSTTLELAKGYTSIHHKGSCSNGCIMDIENKFITAACIKIGPYGKIYNPSTFSVPFKMDTKYIFNDGSFFEPDRSLRIDEIYEHEPLVDTKPLKVFSPSQAFFKNMTWATHKLEETEDYEKAYLVQINRCKLPKKEQYYMNGGYPCGSYLYTYIKYEGFDALYRMSSNIVMLTATKDLKTTSLLKRYKGFNKKVRYYSLVNSKESNNKIKDVEFNIHIDGNFVNKRKDIHKRDKDSDVYIFSSLNFFNRSGKLNQTDINKMGDKEDINIKSSLGGGLSCELKEFVDENGNTTLNIPEGVTNIHSFAKSTISRGLTVQASIVNIEFGNVGVMYDPFFITHLVESANHPQGYKHYTMDDVIALYEEYNNDISTSLAIQCMGRVLRKFTNVKTGEDNLSGREINLFIPREDFLYVFKMLNNLIPRCDLDSFKIFKVNRVDLPKEDITHIISLI